MHKRIAITLVAWAAIWLGGCVTSNATEDSPVEVREPGEQASVEELEWEYRNTMQQYKGTGCNPYTHEGCKKWPYSPYYHYGYPYPFYY